MLGLIGKKVGMTRIYDDDGGMIPVTVIEAGPCRVTQVKTRENDGYEAVQVGFGVRRPKQITRPVQGHLAAAGDGYSPQRLSEFRVEDASAYEVGQELKVDIFDSGEGVDVRGVTKGAGFQGVVKRHGFSGGDATHGNKAHRVTGAIGGSADPARVWPNQKMPGRKGNRRHTVINLQVARVDPENNCLFIKGAVPGPNKGLVTVFKKK